MATTVYDFDWPDRFVVGTVGVPGRRTFFLQVRAGRDLLSVSLEKQQAAALAERIDEVLDSLMAENGNRYSIPVGTPGELDDADPLDEPVDDLFRAGTMSLGWDPATAQIVIEAYAIVEIDAEEFTGSLDDIDVTPEAVLRVRLPVGGARAFAKRARDMVAAGRPACSRCGEPMAGDHGCERPETFR
ncbi:MAG: DUF3090 domain-containing protein [Aeromicrobium sp.]|uniref:DUF3090 domain-containing protein n=1 Tax=Aeromicrobium sp. TaxID=1871063 RepID=UPI0039E452A9